MLMPAVLVLEARTSAFWKQNRDQSFCCIRIAFYFHRATICKLHMKTPFEMQNVLLKEDERRCVVWYDPSYDMYCGAILYDDNIAVVSLLDCHMYSPKFKIRPLLANLSFSIVRDLFQLLLGTPWTSFISNSRDLQTIERMISLLLKLRQYWISKGLNPEWTESTEALVNKHEERSLDSSNTSIGCRDLQRKF